MTGSRLLSRRAALASLVAGGAGATGLLPPTRAARAAADQPLPAALGGARGGVLAPDIRPGHGARLRSDPFLLGVASGDPLPDGVVLWTRLVRDPLDARSMPSADLDVQWEVAADETFSSRVASGVATASPGEAHSLHVDVRGLAPGREYWYRFRVDGFLSPPGRARTAAAPATMPASVRLAVANCQDLQNGYWPAYSALAEEDVDAVLHLGDYIYEYDPDSPFADRRHTEPEQPGLDQLRTLADYRARHAQYRGDPALQAAHAAFSWIVVPDDHEVENNYAGTIDEQGDTGGKHQDPAAFRAQRRAAMTAYWEHLPLRSRPEPDPGLLRLYRGYDFGRLVGLSMLDTRQYRTDQPGNHPHDFGPPSAGLANDTGTMTGREQEDWLLRRLAASSSTWNLVAQQLVLTPLRWPDPADPAAPPRACLDMWDGYAPQRRRLLDRVREAGVTNPVLLAGDVHAAFVNDVHADPLDPGTEVLATEFVAPSISSRFDPRLDALLRERNGELNPHTRFFDGSRHGYLRLDADPHRLLVEQRSVDSISSRQSPVRTTASFVTEAGRPGAVRA